MEKKLTPQQTTEYKAEKREDMQSLFKKIDDGVKAVFEYKLLGCLVDYSLF